MTGGMPDASWCEDLVHVLLAHALLRIVAVEHLYEIPVSP